MKWRPARAFIEPRCRSWVANMDTTPAQTCWTNSASSSVVGLKRLRSTCLKTRLRRPSDRPPRWTFATTFGEWIAIVSAQCPASMKLSGLLLLNERVRNIGRLVHPCGLFSPSRYSARPIPPRTARSCSVSRSAAAPIQAVKSAMPCPDSVSSSKSARQLIHHHIQ